jgi:hypothetical protein
VTAQRESNCRGWVPGPPFGAGLDPSELPKPFLTDAEVREQLGAGVESAHYENRRRPTWVASPKSRYGLFYLDTANPRPFSLTIALVNLCRAPAGEVRPECARAH